ncbi:flagellar protein FlgN [Limimaricola hongkongensis]|uniref:Flagellar P-ring protein n=1 Tax=Limimaricola hongkongensis DSM 17492 TaxID=1122180 RepID=A0A017HIR0_9RHOB|nr:flagellar protein FlgN [Limimaricola hongkongensis]EYD73659.1 flagellar P-ring protein precursor [Limimaricola hongkongensis DSM 17492]
MSAQDVADAPGFDADIAALTDLLEAEIAEIRTGDLSRVAGRLEEKSALAARLDAAGPEIGAALDDEDGDGLRARLDALAALIARDAALLERMREITAEVNRELSRLRDRHGLGGLYGADGHRSARDTLSRASMDKSV